MSDSQSIGAPPQEFRVTGVKVNYLYVCQRKLWLFDRHITMEAESDSVLLGKLLDQSAYPREKSREVLIDNLIRIDVVGPDTIREIKLSNSIADADRAQILYYLFILKQRGINKTGIISYPKLRRTEEVVLTEQDELRVLADLDKIRAITALPNPPKPVHKPICSKCAYCQLCWA
ncbi:MAG: CRISPR-associated protein Cas4 [Magnetococcales bacterium]|nr:CRISPR-associated protein Cas4 [Nitrospirota bacterium]